VNRKILYNIDGNYIHTKVVDKCRKSLVDFLNSRQDGITVAQFRDLVNGNRKICLLLLVQFDREGTTYRDGDLRFLIKQG
jgi:hypothetical protein